MNLLLFAHTDLQRSPSQLSCSPTTSPSHTAPRNRTPMHENRMCTNEESFSSTFSLNSDSFSLVTFSKSRVKEDSSSVKASKSIFVWSNDAWSRTESALFLTPTNANFTCRESFSTFASLSILSTSASWDSKSCALASAISSAVGPNDGYSVVLQDWEIELPRNSNLGTFEQRGNKCEI